MTTSTTMTDALRPRPGLAGWPAGDRAAESARPAKAGARTKEARRPHHVGVLLGLSAGAYAIALAGVTGLQSATDQATIAVRQPALSTLEAVAIEHDRLERELEAARAGLAVAGDGYEAAAAQVAGLQARLESLAATVGELEGQTLALPTRIGLPTAPRVPAAVSRPPTQATSGASGG
jgi:hypothetical protein